MKLHSRRTCTGLIVSLLLVNQRVCLSVCLSVCLCICVCVCDSSRRRWPTTAAVKVLRWLQRLQVVNNMSLRPTLSDTDDVSLAVCLQTSRDHWSLHSPHSLSSLHHHHQHHHHHHYPQQQQQQQQSTGRVTTTCDSERAWDVYTFLFCRDRQLRVSSSESVDGASAVFARWSASVHQWSSSTVNSAQTRERDWSKNGVTWCLTMLNVRCFYVMSC